jgi:hypothetical protein
MSAELGSLVNIAVYDKELESKYLEILNFLLKTPGLTAYDIQKMRSKRYRYYSGSRIALKHLLKLNLIEVAKEKYRPREKNKGKDPKPYRLSLNGIFYVILHNFDGFYEDLVRPLLKNYGSNILFDLFLYPHISQKTLLEIKDDNICYEIFPYLKDVCSNLITSVKSLDSLVFSTSGDGFVLDQIFMWPRLSVPPNSIPFYTNELKKFLKSNFRWEWIDQAKIIPSYKENVIDIVNHSDETSAKQSSIRILINERENRAELRQNSKTLHEFIITPYELFLSIDIETDKRKIDYLIKHLVNGCNDYAISFLTKVRGQIDSNYRSYEPISKDENFAKAISEMDNRIRVRI